MSKMYSINEMIEVAIDEYELETEETKEAALRGKKYYQKFQRALKSKDVNFWGSAPVQTRGKTKAKVFSEEQMRYLFSCKEMYDYLRDNSMNEQIRNSNRYDDVAKEILKRKADYIAYLEEKGLDDENDIPSVRHEDVIKIKENMMIEAIFNLFFTPFNEELLEQDLTYLFLRDEMALTREQIEAERRFANPYGIYYKEKKNTPRR